MRLIDLEIHNIRGIRELKLNPGGKNLVVMGPNGAGKSAVVDAIDFLLSGNISRLSGKGTARITLKKHGAHLSAKPKDVWVKARVSIDGQEIEISRCLANDSKLDCPDEYLYWLLCLSAGHYSVTGVDSIMVWVYSGLSNAS